MGNKYYSLKNLLSCNANWNILFGMRSNGKSYSVKKYVIEQCFKNNEEFVYLRRWSEDIKEKEVSTYFEDCPVKDITKGEYEGIAAFRGFFYWYVTDENDKQVRCGKPIGRYCSLNQAERYKSQVFTRVQYIIFEEFLTNKVYLGGNTPGRNEPAFLMQFVSTVSRDRDIKVFMIGNTISRVCPYFAQEGWGLHNVMKMKPGTIDIYHLRGENGVVDIAVENCEVVETKSKMFFGLASRQITSGEWEVNDVPKLLKPYEFYDCLYEINIKYGDFYYVLQLLFDGDTGGSFIYIYPNTKQRSIERTITNVFDVNPMVTNGLKPEIKAEVLIARLFREGKVCFSDNLTGTDFRQVVDQYKLRGVMIC